MFYISPQLEGTGRNSLEKDSKPVIHPNQDQKNEKYRSGPENFEKFWTDRDQIQLKSPKLNPDPKPNPTQNKKLFRSSERKCFGEKISF